jgi:hypothetical protein
MSVDIMKQTKLYNLHRLYDMLKTIGFRGEYPTLTKTLVNEELKAEADIYVIVPEGAGIKGVPQIKLVITMPEDVPATRSSLVIGIVEEIIDLLKKYYFF